MNANYASVFTRDDGSAPPRLEKLVEHRMELKMVSFSKQKVMDKISKLRDNAAPGPDGVTPRILKELLHQLSLPLAVLYEKCMKEKKIPKEWRDLIVVPIYKGGSKFVPKNYRPVNLTLIIAKVMEMIAGDEIDVFAQLHNLISNSQHGFRKGRSCLTNLI